MANDKPGVHKHRCNWNILDDSPVDRRELKARDGGFLDRWRETVMALPIASTGDVRYAGMPGRRLRDAISTHCRSAVAVRHGRHC